MNQPLAHSERNDQVELRIPCKPEWVALARLAVAAVANRMHFSIDEIEDIKLAVAEACTNAIQHADGAASSIDIECQTALDGLHIAVRDRAHVARPEPVNATAEATEGLGVFLIRSLMDEVSYDVRAKDGTELVMFKRLPE